MKALPSHCHCTLHHYMLNYWNLGDYILAFIVKNNTKCEMFNSKYHVLDFKVKIET